MNGAVSSEQIRHITDVYERMSWYGADPAGYAILKPFSLVYDFQGPARSLLFFAETSMRVLLYATLDFSGGEKLRALRHAFDDLEAYLNDPSLREEHGRLLDAECWSASDADRQQEYNSAYPSEVDPVLSGKVDQVWLKQALTGLADVRHIADDAFRRHDHGVVYALRMSLADVGYLRCNRSMGIETTARIPPSRIVGKVIVPPDFEPHGHGRLVDEMLTWQARGLGAALSQIIRPDANQ
jgi:hypothetical protein